MSDGRPQRDWRTGATTPAGGGGQSKSNIFVAGLLAVALAGTLAGFGYWLVSGGDNYVGYVNDTVDQALASVGSLKTNDELKAAFSLVNQAMQQDVPMINVYVSEPLGAVSNRLVNAEPHAYGSFNHVEQWDIAQ